MKYFESRTVGEVLSRITNDVDTLGQGLNQSVAQLITSVATLVGILVMMLSISPVMTLIALVILPVSAALIGVVVKFSQKYFVAQQKYLGEINGQVEEVFSGHTIVKAFNKEEDMVKTFHETNGILYQSAWKSQFLSGMIRSSSRGGRDACHPGQHRGRGNPVLYPVRPPVHPTYCPGGAGFQYAAVHGSGSGAGL